MFKSNISRIGWHFRAIFSSTENFSPSEHWILIDGIFQKTSGVRCVSLENRKLNENLIFFSFYSLFFLLDTPEFWKQRGAKSLPHTPTSPTIVITEHTGASSSLDLNFEIKSVETMAESPMMPSPSYSSIESKMDDSSFESSITSSAAVRMTNKNSHKGSTAICQKKSVTLPPASLTNEEIQGKSRAPTIQKEIKRQSVPRYAAERYAGCVVKIRKITLNFDLFYF